MKKDSLKKFKAESAASATVVAVAAAAAARVIGDDLTYIKGRLDAQDKALLALKEQIQPMADVYSSVRGFNGVAMWILKALILFGAGLGVLYGFIKYLKH